MAGLGGESELSHTKRRILQDDKEAAFSSDLEIRISALENNFARRSLNDIEDIALRLEDCESKISKLDGDTSSIKRLTNVISTNLYAI